MAQKNPAGISHELIEPDAMCTLEELCHACNVQAAWVAELVDHGVIEPAGRTQTDWQFTSVSIVRVAKAKRLERDLSLNPPGVALVLELLDEIEELRSCLKSAAARP